MTNKPDPPDWALGRCGVDGPLGVRAEIRGDRLRRLAGLLRRVPETGAHYYDSLFEQPDLVEDDYYRFRNQPRGC